MSNPYIGITYPKLFRNFLCLWLCKKLFCKRHRHLLDEVWSPPDHYLVCDACGLIIYIKNVDFKYCSRRKND